MDNSKLDQVKRDPEFYKTNEETMRSVLEDADPQYLNLSDKEKDYVVNNLHNNMPEKYIAGIETFEQDPPVSTYESDMEYEGPEGDLIADIAPSKFEDISTITGRPSSELEEFPDFGKVGDVLAEAAPAIGGTIGGMVGFGAGTGLGSLPLSVGGAGLGGMAGEAYRTIWYGFTERGEIAETAGERFEKIGKSGLEEMAWETVGLAVGLPLRIIRKSKNVLKRASRKTIPGQEQLTLGESMDEGWLRTTMENIENIATIGSHETDKLRKKMIIEKAIRQKIHKTLGEEKDLGELLFDSLMVENKNWQELCQSSYGSLNSHLTTTAKKIGKSDRFIDTSFLKDKAKNMLSISEKINIKGDTVDELKRIMEMEDFVSFRAAKLQWGRMFSTNIDKRVNRIGNQFKNDVGEQIKKFDESGISQKLWDSSNTLYKEGIDIFNEESVKELLQAMPGEDLYKSLVQPNNEKNLNKIKDLLLNKYTLARHSDMMTSFEPRKTFHNEWKKLQNTTYSKLLKNSTFNGVLSGKQLKQELKRLGTTTDAIFQPFPNTPKSLLNKKKHIEELADHLARLEPKTKFLNLVAITVGTPTALFGAASILEGGSGLEAAGKITLTAGGIVLSSKVLGKLTGSKTGLKIVKEIAKTPIRAGEKLITLTLRANNFLDRMEKRDSWLEQRVKKGIEKKPLPIKPPDVGQSAFIKPARAEILKELFE